MAPRLRPEQTVSLASSPSAASDAERLRWRRVKAVFLEALEREPSARSTFVGEACRGDDDLRREVESLLASEQAATTFCETPAAGLLASGAAAAAGRTPRLAPGQRLGAYEVVAFVSAGGMGEVYRARHTVLGRQVAIKTVSAALEDEGARRRLIREAQHAARLDHPSICRIFEVGEADGTPFIVMQFVEGRALRDVVHAERPSLDQALTVAVQVADALAHAHAHGIVHRDLKSANVVLDARGRAIVLDFGLAKRLPREGEATAGDSTVTAPGGLAGTLSHMAPEVLLGRPADARSDVWSLGVMLHELLTGELPFTGRTPFETSAAILGEPPRRMRAAVPAALRQVVERCLEKDPDGRWQRAADVREALEAVARRRAWPLVGRLLVSVRWRAFARWTIAVLAVAAAARGALRLRDAVRPAGGGRISTLAFLPLENATADSGATFYARGITEAITGTLGALADVRIVSPAAAEGALRSARTRAATARRLGADAIVEGRFRRVADRILVDVRLVEPSGGRVLWSDAFERSAAQVLALEDDIVRGIAAEVKLASRPGAQQRAIGARRVNPEAYEAYLRGRYEWNRRTQRSLQRAVAYFARAIELDPTYAPAHAALADCYNQFGTVMMGTGSPRVYRPLAAREAIAALQIDPYSAEAHAALGYVHHYDWRWAEAEREFRRAIELNPNYALAHLWYANLLMSRRRLPEALAEVNAARALDPFSLIVNTNVAWVLSAAGRHEEAIAQLRWTIGLDSTYWHAHWRLVSALLATGRAAEGRAAAEHLVTITGRAPSALALLAEVRAETGDRTGARALLAELLRRARTEYVPPGSLAAVYEALGDVEGQLPWTRRAVEERSNAIAYVDPDRGVWARDPRFRALLRQAGLR